MVFSKLERTLRITFHYNWDTYNKQTIGFLMSDAATGGVLKEKMLLEISQYSWENTCVRISFLIKLARVFYGEFCEISNNIFFTEHLWATASVMW